MKWTVGVYAGQYATVRQQTLFALSFVTVECVAEYRAQHFCPTFIFQSLHSRGPRENRRAIAPLPRPNGFFASGVAAHC